MLFGWKKRILRLHTLMLSSAPLNEIEPELHLKLEIMRKGLRGTASPEEVELAMVPRPAGPMRHLWEPVALYGWDLAVTMYLLDGKPWWIARANHKKDDPPTKDMEMIRAAVDYLGAHPDRDCLMNTSFGGGNGYGMWWTWINQAPLLEVHIAGKGRAAQMQIVPAGSNVKPGWERVDRNQIGAGSAT